MKESVQTQQKGLVGKYYPYPEYKDSGVEWLGEVPSEWIATRLKFIASINMGQSPNSEDCNDLGIGNPFLQGNAEFGQRSPTPKQYCDSAKKNANVGDFLFSVRAPVGAVNIADQRYGIGRGLCAIRSHEDIAHLYLWWVLQTSKIQFDAISTGSTFEAVSSEQVCNFALAIPSKYEQHTIATFLDYETARIDQLITKQQQLIELLKEKRQAVITQAVTKGLNPKVPMKNAGVEWLEQVPEHWTVTTLRNLIRAEAVILQDGNHGELHPTASEYVDDGIPFLMANNVRDGRVNLTDCKRISKNRADMLRIGFAKAGDMLLTHKGTVGEVAMIPADISGPYWMLTPQVTYYRWTEDKFDAAFYMYQFQSKSILTQLDIIGSKQSTRAYVGLIAQGDLVVTVPPIMEQRAIREELRKHAERFDRMFARATGLIELLQERRTALISAAVTGKIDLRGWTPPAEEVAA